MESAFDGHTAGAGDLCDLRDVAERVPVAKEVAHKLLECLQGERSQAATGADLRYDRMFAAKARHDPYSSGHGDVDRGTPDKYGLPRDGTSTDAR